MIILFWIPGCNWDFCVFFQNCRGLYICRGLYKSYYYTPRWRSQGGVYWFETVCPSVRPSVRPSVPTQPSCRVLYQYRTDMSRFDLLVASPRHVGGLRTREFVWKLCFHQKKMQRDNVRTRLSNELSIQQLICHQKFFHLCVAYAMNTESELRSLSCL